MNRVYFSKKVSIILGLLVIIVYCLPYFLLGDSAFITIHDYLDGSLGHLNNIIRNNLFFSFSGEVPLMDGVSRMSIPFTSPFELKNIVYYLVPGYWGIVGSILLVKICAFLGMFLLAEQYIIKNNLWLCLLVSLLFSFIPFYIDYSFSSAGVPLLLYSLLNLYHKRLLKTSNLIVILFAFNSSLALTGFFVCFLLFFLLLYLFVKERQFNWQLIIALCALSLIYIVTNWEVILGFFLSSGVSHRVEMINHYTFSDLAIMAFARLKSGFYHAGSFSAWPIILLFFFVFAFYRKIDKSLYCYAISFFLLSTLIVVGVFLRIIPLQLLSSFQFDRFYFLYPSLCFILLAKTFQVLYKRHNYILLIFSIVISIINIANTNRREYNENINRLFGNTKNNAPSYCQFFDEDIFKSIFDDLKIKQDYKTKVVSVGIFPSVAEYNGFYCLDGYISSYSLDYKHQFRNVIKEELEKSESIKTYFDEWGNRCYVFSAQLGDSGFLCGKKDNCSIQISIDTLSLRKLGCEYIISAVDIINYKELNLSYVNSFTTDASYWNIRVYKII